MTGTWTEAQLFARWGHAVRRAAHPPFSYIRAHAVPDPENPPATLPGEQGETVTLWTPTYEDTLATDWGLY